MFVNFVKKFVKIKNVVDEKIVYIDILYNKFLEVSLFFLIGVLFYCSILFIYSIIFLYSVNLIYVVNYLIYFVFEILWII